jgi:hypothetical protein
MGDILLPYQYVNLSQLTGYSYSYEELRKLPSTSAYAGYPIYKKIKINTKTFASERVGTEEYWVPVEGEGYKVFETGDDASTVARSTPLKASLNPLLKGKSDYKAQPGTRVTYAGKQYVATTKTILWGDLAPGNAAPKDSVTSLPAIGLSTGSLISNKKVPIRITTNPYSYDAIQIWILDPNESGYSFTNSSNQTVLAQFWYHPINKQFYALSDALKVLSISLPQSTANIGASYYTYVADLLGDTYKTNPRVLTQFAVGLIPPSSPSLKASLQQGLVQYLVANKALSLEVAIDTVTKGTNNTSIIQQFVGGTSKPSAVSQTKRRKKNVSTTTGKKTTGPGGISPLFNNPSRTATSRPQMVQNYNEEILNTPISNRYVFLFPPNQINYTGIGSEWTDIERSGQTPLIDWKGYKLLQVSFQFLIAPDGNGTFEGITGESFITLDVEDEIATLRRMAVTPYPVTLLGFDALMSEQIGYPYIPGRGVEFVISELNITSLYRTTEGKINRAQCDITLREIHANASPLITFPRLRIPGIKLPPKDKLPEDGGNTLLSQTSNYAK